MGLNRISRLSVPAVIPLACAVMGCSASDGSHPEPVREVRQADSTGAPLWAFVCGGGRATLLGPDGSTQWSTPVSVASVRADVTSAVARCIGQQGSGIGIVAFSVQ